MAYFWLPKQITGPASVLINLNNGCTFCRHIDDINVRSTQDFHDDADVNPSSPALLEYYP